MKSVLFLIPTLDKGGAENVLLDLVNHMDQKKFRITVQTLFDQNSQKDRLTSGIEYKTNFYYQFRGNSRLMSIIPARVLYRMLVRKKYDIVVSFLEGPTSHIALGCPYEETKKVAWVHVEMDKKKQISAGFKTFNAADRGYLSFDKLVFVAESVKKAFEQTAEHKFPNSCVLYNVLDTDRIIAASKEPVADICIKNDRVNIITVGRLTYAKGYDRLTRIQKKLIEEGYNCHTFILGTGSGKRELEAYIQENNLNTYITLVGFRDNPYKYIAKADLFVCSSRREGFSTAVSEALVLGIPVVSTECSGARELLGNDEYGIITDNEEEALYQGIKRFLDTPGLLTYYRKKAKERGEHFNMEKTTESIENVILSL